MKTETHLDALLNEAKGETPPPPSHDLIARVLADAATQTPSATPAIPAQKPGFLSRLLAPVGGIGGAFALGACAAIGVFIGAGYADSSYSIPGLDGVLAVLTNSTDTTTPFDTLSLLMAES